MSPMVSFSGFKEVYNYAVPLSPGVTYAKYYWLTTLALIPVAIISKMTTDTYEILEQPGLSTDTRYWRFPSCFRWYEALRSVASQPVVFLRTPSPNSTAVAYLARRSPFQKKEMVGLTFKPPRTIGAWIYD